jgi:hypothetical protein
MPEIMRVLMLAGFDVLRPIVSAPRPSIPSVSTPSSGEPAGNTKHCLCNSATQAARGERFTT